MKKTLLEEVLASANRRCEDRNERMIEVINTLSDVPFCELKLDDTPGRTNVVMLQAHAAFEDLDLQVEDFSILHLIVLMTLCKSWYKLEDDVGDYWLNYNKSTLIVELARMCMDVREFADMSVSRCIRAMSQCVAAEEYEHMCMLPDMIKMSCRALPYVFSENTTYLTLLRHCNDILSSREYGADADSVCMILDEALIYPYILYESSRLGVLPNELANTLLKHYIEIYRKGDSNYEQLHRMWPKRA